MSSTPEISKFSIHKVSPFGSAINKNLLTPCRQVGLSRKKKTPNTCVKLPATPDSNTPLSHKTAVSEPNKKIYLSNCNKSDGKQIHINKRTGHRIGINSKKTLIPFSSDTADEVNNTLAEPIQEDADFKNVTNVLSFSKEEKLTKDVALIPLNAARILSERENNICKTDIIQMIEEGKNEIRKFEDSDNAEKVISKAETTLKTKICKITLRQLTEEEIKENVSKSSLKKVEDNYESDDDFVQARTRKTRVISEDSDFQNSQNLSESEENKSKQKTENDSIGTIEKIKEGTVNSSKLSSKVINSVEHNYESDDDFVQARPRKTRVISDDSDFQNSQNLSESEENKSKQKTENDSIGTTEKIEESTVNISKLSSKVLNSVEQNYESDDFVQARPKKIIVISDDDSDFQNSPKLDEFKERSNKRKSKEELSKTIKHKKNDVEKKPKVNTVKSINSIDDADDTFTFRSDKKPEEKKKKQFEQNYELDDDFMDARPKKIRVICDDDSDFQNSPNKRQKLTEKRIKKIKLEKTGEEKNTNAITIKTVNSISDDDDAFTSTPEREKNERICLLNEVKDMEAQIKNKREQLEALKQAAIYKSKHKISELQSLTDTWRRGCVEALNSLLEQLKVYKPIDMPILLSSLHIPSDIAKSKLNLVW